MLTSYHAADSRKATAAAMDITVKRVNRGWVNGRYELAVVLTRILLDCYTALSPYLYIMDLMKHTVMIDMIIIIVVTLLLYYNRAS